MTSLRLVSLSFVLQLAYVGLAPAQVFVPEGGPPAISVLADAVEVTNITPGGKVVWFGATQVIAEDEVAEIRAYASIGEDTDGNGVDRLEFPAGVPLHSTWVAVDLTTGAPSSTAPAGFPLRRVPWQGQGIRVEGAEDIVEDARQTGNLLVVRPNARGEGSAWLLEAGDGGPTDKDGLADGIMRLPLSALKPLGRRVAAPPSRFQPGDVVAMLDPRRLELTLVTIR